MTKLSIEDWRDVQEVATDQLHQANKVIELQTYILNCANEEIAKLSNAQ